MVHIAHIQDKRWETVQEHTENVKQRSKQYTENIGLEYCAILQAIFHDQGKLCIDFDRYIRGENQIQRGEIDHCFPGARYLKEFATQIGDKAYSNVSQIIAHTVCSHHGLHDWLLEDGSDYLKKRIMKEERYEEIKKNIKENISDEELMLLLRKASAEYETKMQEILALAKTDDRKKRDVQRAFYMGMLERLMQSILVDADRTETAGFMTGIDMELSCDSKSYWSMLHHNMEIKCSKFAEKKDPISLLRSDISCRCAGFAEKEAKICRLIVPTGGGKTLSGLRYAIEYCRKHGKQRIFYISPFKSIIEQNSEVIREIVGDEFFLEHHSDVISKIDTEKEQEEYELRSEKWDSKVIATTLVQFLDTLFSGKMASVRRMHRLCESVIIIDEIQAIPIKCVSLFNLAMNFLAYICNATIVLCSATQPLQEETRYPLIVDKDVSITGDCTADFVAFQRTKIVSKRKIGGYTYDEAADFCWEQCDDKGCVLFVVNTKKAAFELYNRLCVCAEDETVEIIHLSTNMCPAHRNKVIAHMKSLLKSVNQKKKMICVTTALIEAGVDISFPCVIRSLSGLDHVAQAAGRCNRNGEFGTSSEVYVLELSEEKLGALQEIAEGQSIADSMIESGNYDDLLTVQAQSEYFRRFYFNQKEMLEYNVMDMDCKTDLLNLLSLNKERWCAQPGRKKITCCRQAFATAGSLFHVIEENTIDILVPYNQEAKELIAKFNGELKAEQMRKDFRNVQKYIVSIYPGMEKSLNARGALMRLSSGVLALKDEYYDNILGVILEGKEMEFLMF